MYLQSNLSAAEALRMYGMVSREQLEQLVEHEGALKSAKGAVAHISEAMGCFPAEDFLTPILKQMRQLCGNLRGDNRHTLENIISELEGVETTTFGNSDYGVDECKKAIACINGEDE